MQAVYNNLETGNHLKDIPTDAGIPAFKRPATLAKRLGASRSLHFKSGGDWFDYNELYGHGNLFEGVITQLERHARNRAVMETYGPNPEAMRDSIIDRLIVETKKANVNAPVETLEAMKRKNNISNAQFRSAAGIHLTGNPTWARRMADVRAVMNMSSLGTSILGQFSDLAFPVRGSVFAIGDFINALVSFLLIAAAVYFFVVTPINALVTRMRKSQAPADPTTKKCPECLSEIPIDARRCAHCSQPVAGKAA